MKKIVSAILALTLVIGLVLSLTSCSLMFGSYTNDTLNTTYKFLGNQVTRTTEVTIFGVTSTTTAEGTFEIGENSDGDTVITFDWDEEDEDSTSISVPFEQGVDDEGNKYIKILGVKYIKE